MIPVYLITGFLGSGKTTWLKQIARDHRDRRFVYLVNDFATVDVDGELVRQAGEHVLAISGGSIFCRCLVMEFIGILRAVAEGRVGVEGAPEAVLIEASGMADPRVMQGMLKETGLDASFEIQRIVALVDPGTFHKLLETLPNIRAQIECADTVLISKPDCYSSGQVEDTRRRVAAIQPDADCQLLLNGRTDLRLFEPAQRMPAVSGGYAPCVDPNFHRFIITESVPDFDTFRRRVEATKEHLYRAKGFIEKDGAVYAVDWSTSGLTAEAWRGARPDLRVACICNGAAGEEVEQTWKSHGSKT